MGRTLVLQQFYSAIVRVAYPELVEGFGNSIEHNNPIFLLFFTDLKKWNTIGNCGRTAHIRNAMHPDSYRDRGHLFFIADYLEDPAVTEITR